MANPTTNKEEADNLTFAAILRVLPSSIVEHFTIHDPIGQDWDMTTIRKLLAIIKPTRTVNIVRRAPTLPPRNRISHHIPQSDRITSKERTHPPANRNSWWTPSPVLPAAHSVLSIICNKFSRNNRGNRSTEALDTFTPLSKTETIQKKSWGLKWRLKNRRRNHQKIRRIFAATPKHSGGPSQCRYQSSRPSPCTDDRLIKLLRWAPASHDPASTPPATTSTKTSSGP